MALAMNTPLAEALNQRIQPKLVDIGWSFGDDNSPLGEYICLMMVNGKSREQIATELSGDLLGLGPDDRSATEFAEWLFDTLEKLKSEMGGAGGAETDEAHAKDLEMQDLEDGGEEGVPTAPKAMRQPNPRRLMNQLTKAMERKPNDALHRVRPQPSERVEKFKREPPKGPRQNGSRPNNNPNNRHHQNRMNGRPFGPNGNMVQNMTPQQQMAFYQMYQQQSHMIAPFSNGPPVPYGAPMGGPMNGPMNGPLNGPMNGPMNGPHGRRNMHTGVMSADDAYSNNFSEPQRTNASLFERIQAPPDLNEDSAMDTTGGETDDQWGGSGKGEKLEEVPCKFGTACTKPECPFGHPTPAHTGKPTLYTSGEKCPFGTGCKNRKCTGSHPSPACAPNFSARGKIDQDCKFFPNCTNPTCPFKHPAMPMCRNGANCTRPNCHFTHTAAPCKFNPCLNPNCIYKHEEGQQQAPQASENSFGNKVWTAPGKEREHVSERKFMSEDGAEELIIPGQTKESDMDNAPLNAE